MQLTLIETIAKLEKLYYYIYGRNLKKSKERGTKHEKS